jgi:hypothetical protein
MPSEISGMLIFIFFNGQIAFQERNKHWLLQRSLYKNVTFLFSTAILNENMQRDYGIYSILLPVYTRKDQKVLRT